MKNMLNLVTAALLCVLTTSGIAQTYHLSEKTRILNWTGKAALNAYSLTGTVQIEEAHFIIENDTIKELFVLIDMPSLNHENDDLMKHLKSKDFFQVNKFRKAKFELLKPANIVQKLLNLVGKMTIKKTSQTETLTVYLSKTDEGTILLKPEIILNRTPYGITYNSPTFFENLKKNAIADEFELTGELVFEKLN